MHALLRRIAARLTYANVVATIALCLAVGTGGAYAASQLARNSVGAPQLKKNSVTSRAVKNGSLTAGDLSRRARQRLAGKTGATGPAGPQGPAGVSDFAIVDNGGGFVGPGGTALSVRRADNTYSILMRRSVTQCAYTASLSTVTTPGLGPVDPPPGGTATVGDDGNSTIIVRTYDAAGNPTPAGFRLVVAC